MQIVFFTKNPDLLKVKQVNDRFGAGDPWVLFRSPDDPTVKGINPDGVIIDYDTIEVTEELENLIHTSCSNLFNLCTDKGLQILRTRMIADYKRSEIEARQAHQKVLDSWEDSFSKGYPMK